MTTALALLARAPAAPAPANDNPPKRDGDLWRFIIDSLKGIDTRFAVYAAQCKLAGERPHAFVDRVLAGFAVLDAAKAAGVVL